MTPRETAIEVAKRLRTAHPHARYELDWQTPGQLLVATVLAAGSKDSAVNEVTKPLFARWPDLKSLAGADPAALQALLTPLGLAAQKTPRLLALAKAVVEQYGGQVPKTLSALTALPGVGRKTANVVLTQGFGLPSGVIVDVHVSRVARRLGLSARDEADDIEADLAKVLPEETWVHFGAAAVLHGRHTCTAKAPRCADCVLENVCPSAEATHAAPPAPPSASGWPSEYQLPSTPSTALGVSGADAGLKASGAAAGLQPSVQAERSRGPASAPSTPLGVSGAGALPADWAQVLAAELSSDWYRELNQRVAAERAQHTVYPPAADVFTAFHLTPWASLRVVLLGQDPYHGAGQAHGLAFSVQPGVKPPPSLVNIFKELKADLGCTVPDTGCLVPWAKQGVLLLNTALTVREAEAGSHADFGWARLTDAVIRHASARAQHTVFVLWGGHARKKVPLIDTTRHSLVEGAHPSPLSQKLWFGSRPFSAINQALRTHGQEPIAWQL